MTSGPSTLVGGAAFWISLLLVSYWAYWNFHAPRAPVTLRNAVTLHRYLLALALYVLAAVSVFLLVLVAVLLQQSLLVRSGVLLRDGDGALVGPSLFAALLATVLLPRLPGTGNLHALMRQQVHRLALYPEELQRLLAELARQPVPVDRASWESLRREVARYGLEVDTLERCLPEPVIARLDEAQTLHDRFEAMLAEGGLRGFREGAAEEIARAQMAHARLLRRVARTMVLAEAIRSVRERAGATPPEREAVEDFSNLDQFLAEEAVTVALIHRELVARAALCAFVRRSARNAFLRRMGFGEDRTDDLPFAAVLGVLAVVPASCFVFVGFVAVTQFLASVAPGIIPPPPSASFKNLLAVAPIIAVQQLIVVLCAVMPKVVSGAARPSPGGVPVLFNAAAAAAAYAISLGLFAAVMHLVPPPPPPGQAAPPDPHVFVPVVSLFAAVLVLALAFRIDGKLRDPEFRFRQGRISDALVLAAALGATDVLVQTLLGGLMARWAFNPALTVQMAVLGGMIGFLVPYVVAAYLNREAREIAAVRQTVGGAQAAAAENRLLRLPAKLVDARTQDSAAAPAGRAVSTG